MGSESKTKRIFKRLLIILPIIIAMIIFVMLLRSKKEPESRLAKESAKSVRIIIAKKTTVIPRVIGYGYAEPGQVWQIVPEVSGKIVEVNDSFKKGNFAKKDDVILRVDPSEYRLAVAQMEANIENIKAQISELNRKKENYETSLGIEEKLLDLKDKNVKRNKKALASQSISHVQYEKTLMDYQSQSAKVQEIKNSLNLIPTSRKALEANLGLNQAQLEDAKLNLRRTAVVVPFDCRITSISAEIGQYVQRGQTVGEADGIGTTEISAQIPMNKMRILMQARGTEISSEEMVNAFEQSSMERIREAFGLKIKARLRSGDFQAEWNARFARADATIDANTGTLGIIAVIDNPYQKIILGKRPPLIRNAYCEVEISGKPVSQVIIIPKSALHGKTLYMADSKNRLKRKKIVTDFAQTNFYVIKEGIGEDEKIVVSDLIPAIEGMLLDPIEDKELNDNLLTEANGNGEIK